MPSDLDCTSWGNSRKCWGNGTDKDEIAIVHPKVEDYTDYEISTTSKIKTIGVYMDNDINKKINSIKDTFKSSTTALKVLAILVPTFMLVYIYKGVKSGK